MFNVAAYKKLPDQYKKLLEDLKPGAYQAIETAYIAKDKTNEKKWSSSIHYARVYSA